MKNSFRKMIALLSVFVMTLALVAIPNVSAKAEEEKGEVNFANGFDWSNSLKNIYVYASTNEDDFAGKMCGQNEAFLDWSHTIVLDRNEDYNYVVTSTTPGGQDNTADEVTLGEGRIVISFNGAEGAEANHPESYNFFMSLQVNDVVAASTYWEAIAAASGAVTDIYFTKAEPGSTGPKFPLTKGALTLANGFDNVGAVDITVLTSTDSTKTVNDIVVATTEWNMGYWYGFAVEYNEANGTWIVTEADMVCTDGGNSLSDNTFGEGKMVVLFHDLAAADADSFAFFKATVKVGREYYLIGEVSAEGALEGVYLSTEAPAEDGPVDDGTTDEPAIKDTGDNFVLMFVILFAGLAMVVVATAARKRA